MQETSGGTAIRDKDMCKSQWTVLSFTDSHNTIQGFFSFRWDQCDSQSPPPSDTRQVTCFQGHLYKERRREKTCLL